MAARVPHVVVFVQENHTTDNYFRSMRAWSADVATGWPTQSNPPAKDQPHRPRRPHQRYPRRPRTGQTTPAWEGKAEAITRGVPN